MAFRLPTDAHGTVRSCDVGLYKGGSVERPTDLRRTVRLAILMRVTTEDVLTASLNSGKHRRSATVCRRV